MDRTASSKEGYVSRKSTGQASEQIDSDLERRFNLAVLVLIVIMLLCVIIIPGSWFNTASMWCKEHLPGF
ncbi:MAG: hypothetical protein DRH70_01025 [Candidatus Coatesbacteria bacterium]|nr:MAG: hypothetical protein DRH70_01025 [Candidatus Coatesbacteria bacterium]